MSASPPPTCQPSGSTDRRPQPLPGRRSTSPRPALGGLVALALCALPACSSPAPADADTVDAARDIAPDDGATTDTPGADDAPDSVPAELDATQPPSDAADTAVATDGDGAGPPADAPDATVDVADAPDSAEPDAPSGDAGTDAGGSPDAASCAAGAPCALAYYPGPCREGRCDASGACTATPIPNCCTADAECALLPVDAPCDVHRCVYSQCTLTRVPGCCDGAGGCDDGLACTTDACGEATGRCSHCPDSCPCPPPLLEEGFDGPALNGAFFVRDDAPYDSVTWRSSTRRALRPPGAAYLGRAECPTYSTGALGPDCRPLDPFDQDATRVRAALETSPIYLPVDLAAPLATVWLWADVEPWLGLGAGEPDVLRVFAAPTDGRPSWELTSSLAVGKRTFGGWRLLALDLTPWRGEYVRLAFAFDTLDGQHNDHEGVYLDELRVVSGGCGGGCCTTDADCAASATGPADPCSTPRCVALSGGAGRLCVDVPDRPGEACTPCAEDGDCSDLDACTTDRCGASGACEHVAFCCLRLTAWQDGFEWGLSGWGVDDPEPGDAVAWHPTAAAFAGQLALAFGDPATGTYETGAPVRGALISGPIALPASSPGRGVELAFALALETEWVGPLYDNPAGVDRLTLELLTSQTVQPVWSSDAIEGTTEGAWAPIAVDLTAWSGQTVQLRFTFDSADADANAFAGPRLDALELRTSCPPGAAHAPPPRAPRRPAGR